MPRRRALFPLGVAGSVRGATSRGMRWFRVVMVGWLVLGAGCAAARQEASAPEASETKAAEKQDKRPDALPPLLEGLDLDASQRAAYVALRDDVKAQLAPFGEAVRDLVRAYARAASACRTDLPAIEQQSSWVVTAGEGVRDPVLVAINRLHAILTPEQRHRLAARLLGAEQESKTGKRDGARTRSLGDALDVSLGQMVVLLARAAVLREKFEKDAAPMRRDYERALAAFERADFDARREPAAKAEVFVLGTKIARDGFRVLLPELDAKQCEALGRYLDERLAE